VGGVVAKGGGKSPASDNVKVDSPGERYSTDLGTRLMSHRKETYQTYSETGKSSL